MRSLLLVFSAVFLLGETATAQSATPKCNRPHEVLKCVRDCPPERTCKNRNIQYKCAVDKRCKYECRCQEGYIRTYLGDCEPKEVCDRCPGAHEFYQCGPECDTECATMATQNRTNCPYVNIRCNDKCYCEDGYARDDQFNCVPVNECKSSSREKRDKSSTHVCKGPNEEYAKCKPTCPPETCLSLVAKFNCFTDQPCKPRCVCKPGHLRKSAEEDCMPTEQCPQMTNRPYGR